MTEATTRTATPFTRPPASLEAFPDVLVAPGVFFERLRPIDARSAATQFAGLMGLLPAGAMLVSFPIVLVFARTGYAHPVVLTMGFLGALLLKSIVGPILAILLGAYGVGGLVHGVRSFSGGTGPYHRSVVIAAYALAPLALERVLARLLFFVPLIRDIFRITPFIACGWWAVIVAAGVVGLHGGRRPVALALSAVAAPVLLFMLKVLQA
jgi:hypothetical protein